MCVPQDSSHSTLLKLLPHTHARMDVPHSRTSQGYKVKTLMVMDDVDTPSHRPNSTKERTNIHKAWSMSMRWWPAGQVVNQWENLWPCTVGHKFLVRLCKHKQGTNNKTWVDCIGLAWPNHKREYCLWFLRTVFNSNYCGEMKEGKWHDYVIVFTNFWCFPLRPLEDKTVRRAENLLGTEQMDFTTFVIALLKGTEIKQSLIHSSWCPFQEMNPQPLYYQARSTTSVLWIFNIFLHICFDT